LARLRAGRPGPFPESFREGETLFFKFLYRTQVIFINLCDKLQKFTLYFKWVNSNKMHPYIHKVLKR